MPRFTCRKYRILSSRKWAFKSGCLGSTRDAAKRMMSLRVMLGTCNCSGAALRPLRKFMMQVASKEVVWVSWAMVLRLWNMLLAMTLRMLGSFTSWYSVSAPCAAGAAWAAGAAAAAAWSAAVGLSELTLRLILMVGLPLVVVVWYAVCLVRAQRKYFP